MHAPSDRIKEFGDAPTLYLLFAGYHGDDRRGSGDLVATLASQREAQEAFRQVRMEIPNRDGWAELTAVSASGQAKALGWFGRSPTAGASPVRWVASGARSVVTAAPGARNARWRLKWRRRSVGLAGAPG